MERPVLELPVDSSWERGLLGVTHDPGFPSEPFIYVCWVAREPYPHHRVSRFVLHGDVVDLASETTLLAGDDQRSLGGEVPAGHQGGAIHFGPDGKLYLAIGEQTAGAPSQSLGTFQGKILRIERDGAIPADNPFFEETEGKYRAIWARGLRNPFTFCFDPKTCVMLIHDVGGKFEEINRGIAGANYGWPTVDHGPTADERFTGPIHWYPQASISGGDFVPENSGWPRRFHGRLVFAEFVHGWIRSFDPEHPGSAEVTETIVTGLRRPTDLRFGPDGTLWIVLRNAWVVDDKFEGRTGTLLAVRPVRPR